MWSGEAVCTENCGDDVEEKEVEIKEEVKEELGEMLIRGF